MHPLERAVVEFLPYLLAFAVGAIVPRRQGKAERVAIGITAALSILFIKSMWPALAGDSDPTREWKGLLSLIVFLPIFGAIALLLAAIGVYGVLSYAVSQRTQEIGVRMALGANRRDVFSLVVSQGARLAAAGIICGVIGAFGITRVVTRLLYNVTATDPLTFATVALLLTAVATAACYFPARRAMKVEPVVALRHA